MDCDTADNKKERVEQVEGFWVQPQRCWSERYKCLRIATTESLNSASSRGVQVFSVAHELETRPRTHAHRTQDVTTPTNTQGLALCDRVILDSVTPPWVQAGLTQQPSANRHGCKAVHVVNRVEVETSGIIKKINQEKINHKTKCIKPQNQYTDKVVDVTFVIQKQISPRIKRRTERVGERDSTSGLDFDL